jgi:hypothetical protein
MLNRIEPALMILTALLLIMGAGCGGDDPAGPDPDPDPDVTPPAAVTDLSIQSVVGSTVTIAWTAPGDDGDQGRAAQYDVRWSAAPITAGTWAGATAVAGVAAPGDPGVGQTATFESSGKADVYVALKTADEVPNWSDLSNVASETSTELFEIHLLTDVDSNDEPCVHNGVVVWVRDKGIDGEEIYMHDLEDPTSMITQRTGNGGEKHDPTNIDRNYIVWSGRETPTDDWEIYTCSGPDMCTDNQITDNDYDDHRPIAINTHSFVWEQSSGFFADIRYFNVGSGLEQSLSEQCCPIGDYTSSQHDADGDWAVWRTTDAGLTGHSVYLWNIVTDAHYDLTETVNANTALAFSLDDGNLAYESGGDGWWIAYWDGADVQLIAEGESPSLSEGRIAYVSWNGMRTEVHYWDGTTIHEITPDNTYYYDAQPCLYGDWLVWVRRSQGGDGHIMYTRVRD